MVVGNHLFSFFDKKFREGVTRYELHPPSLRTVYFPTAPCWEVLCMPEVIAEQYGMIFQTRSNAVRVLRRRFQSWKELLIL